jgi:dolichol-phosphate mannosyltransferase
VCPAGTPVSWARVPRARRLPLDAPVALAGAVVLARLARGRRRCAPLATGGPPPAGSISVVIPARDEQARLPACLAGLAGDGDVTEVIVVDDRSADETEAVAAAGGARVVAGAPLPAGWAGKAWALEQGLRAARGQIVVFLDADARPRRGLVRALAAELVGADAVSAGPRFRCATAPARALHASMLATLVLRFGPADVAGWQPSPRRAVLNGQCVAARAATLRAAGGWARVGSSLVEDVALARALRADGRRLRFVDAADLLAVEAYGSAAETWRGWGRSLMAAEATSRAWLAADLAVLWLAMALPLPLWLARRRRATGALVALRLALLAGLARSYEPRGAGFWLSPLADLAVVARLTASVLRPERTWRGRTYPAARTAPRSGT